MVTLLFPKIWFIDPDLSIEAQNPPMVTMKWLHCGNTPRELRNTNTRYIYDFNLTGFTFLPYGPGINDFEDPIHEPYSHGPGTATVPIVFYCQELTEIYVRT